MFERLKRAFGRKQSPVGAGRVFEPVFAGHVIEIVNAGLNLSLYGSLHEIRLAAADAVSTPFLDVVNNLGQLLARRHQLVLRDCPAIAIRTGILNRRNLSAPALLVEYVT